VDKRCLVDVVAPCRDVGLVTS